MFSVFKAPLCLLLLLVGGCALNPYAVEDPTIGFGISPKPSSIIKSLRCEVMTFIVANRLRTDLRKSFDASVQAGKLKDRAQFEAAVAILKKYRFIDLDPLQLAAVYLDFKDTHTLGATFADDRKVPEKSGSRTTHWGTGYTDTRSFQLSQPFAVSQAGDLGPERAAAPAPLPGDNIAATKYSTIYLRHDPLDEDFYCYKSLANSRSVQLDEIIGEIQQLVEHADKAAAFENFTRITVGLRGVTLARWLQETAEDMALNSRAVYATTEHSVVGQLSYVFTLSAKPAADFRYTLIADLINPRVPAVAASLEHVGTFSIYLNSLNALPVLGARTGNSKPK